MERQSRNEKETHRHKGCGWLASRRCSEYYQTPIVAKDMVGLLLGEVVVSTKKTHIVTKDVVGLQVGDIVVRMIV